MSTGKLKHGLTDLKGTTVGALRVLQRVRSSKGKRPNWLCECECGKRVTVAHNRLIHKTNPKTHCGCKRGGLPKKHPRTYHAWWDARARCHDPNHPSYPLYGARGVEMCDKWRQSFEAFVEDVGPRPSSKYSLDRIDAHGNYEPGNVRWADDKTQARNKKNTKWVKHPETGKPIKAADLADELGVSYNVLRNRMLNKGTWYDEPENPNA